MRPLSNLAAAVLLMAALAPGSPREDIAERAALISARQATTGSIKELKRQGYSALALDLTSGSGHSDAANGIRKAGLRLCYWIEVARCPELADAHPEWMASLQGHPEWRRHFPDFPQPSESEVVKTYPWIPILYKEGFGAHRDRIKRLLRTLPSPDVILLNGLQAAPSACGCGNILCRWTTDYGPVKTATALGPDSAARFVAAVKALAPRAEVIPVWTTECQEHEMARSAACDGVSCFSGACWLDYTKQLMPVAAASPRIGALLTSKILGQRSDWVDSAIRSFHNMPPMRNGASIPPARILPILQGWNLKQADRAAQIESALRAGSTSYVMALTPIEQSWQPRMYRLPPGR